MFPQKLSHVAHKKKIKKHSASVCGGFYDYYKYDEDMKR